MPGVPLTEGEVDRILVAQKTIRDDLVWTYKPDESWIKSEIQVVNNLGIDLRLYANVNMKEPSRFSFSLILSRNFRIMGLDVNGAHVNKHTNQGTWQPGTHKQHWTDRCRDRFAYTPEEEISQDIGDAFRQFCSECKIEFKGQVRSLPPRQIGLDEAL